MDMRFQLEDAKPTIDSNGGHQEHRTRLSQYVIGC
jgi:hypothetical protein